MAGFSAAPLETDEQQAFFQWAKMRTGKYPGIELMFHISNEGKRHPGRAKAEGIVSGIPDIFLPVPIGGYHGAFIEMKRRDGGKLSSNQKKILESLREQGYAAKCCHGWEQAAEFIAKYMDEAL